MPKVSRLPLIKSAAVLFAGIFALAGCAGPGKPSAAPLEKIVLAGLPLDENPDTSSRYLLMMDLIEEATGLPVEFYEAPDYAAVIEGLAAGRAQLAQLDGLTYISAQKLNPEVQVFLGTKRLPDQRPTLLSFGITRTDSGIDELADLVGKRICFPDPSGSTGYLWPALALTKIGIDPDPVDSQDITAVLTGSHPSVGQGVFNGDCDAGFLSDIAWDKIVPNDETIDASQLTSFWESEPIPVGPLVANNSVLPTDLAQKIKTALLEKGNKDYLVGVGLCEDLATCAHLAVTTWGYVEASDSDFDSVREVCNTLQLAQCATKE